MTSKATIKEDIDRRAVRRMIADMAILIIMGRRAIAVTMTETTHAIQTIDPADSAQESNQ